jgi:hypothetical protein
MVMEGIMMGIFKAEALLVIFFVLLFTALQLDCTWTVSESRPDEFQYYYPATWLLAGLAGMILGRRGYGSVLWRRIHHADTLAFGFSILLAGLAIALLPMVECNLGLCYGLSHLSGGRFALTVLLLFVGMYFVGAGAHVREETLRDLKGLPKRSKWRPTRTDAAVIAVSALLLLAILPLVQLSEPPPPPLCGNRPTNVQLYPAQSLGGGNWSIEVWRVTYASGLSCFRVVVQRNDTVVVDMDPLFAGSQNGVELTDSGRIGRLDEGDRFTVTCIGGSRYTLFVIWRANDNVQGLEAWST